MSLESSRTSVCFVRVDMKLREDQRKLQTLLKETITLLCKNSLQSSKGFVIDALIGITTDDASTFLLKLEETVGDVDVEDNVNSKEYDADDAGRRRSRSSRKRPPDGDTRRTDSKRHRSDDDDWDDASDDVYNDNNIQDYSQDVVANYDEDVDINSEEQSTYYDEHVDYDIGNDTKNEHVGNEGDGDLMCVKQEQSDYDDQSRAGDTTAPDDTTPNDTTPGGTAPDDTAPDDTAPDFSSFDVETHDGSSTQSQSSATNDPSASGSQQVRGLQRRYRYRFILFQAASTPKEQTLAEISPSSRANSCCIIIHWFLWKPSTSRARARREFAESSPREKSFAKCCKSSRE